jgi:hypothetical protein
MTLYGKVFGLSRKIRSFMAFFPDAVGYVFSSDREQMFSQTARDIDTTVYIKGPKADSYSNESGALVYFSRELGLQMQCIPKFHLLKFMTICPSIKRDVSRRISRVAYKVSSRGAEGCSARGRQQLSGIRKALPLLGTHSCTNRNSHQIPKKLWVHDTRDLVAQRK